jgi:2-dehydropantoate 2-reductase
MKFAVVGAGSIGTFLGASLADAGYDTTLVARGEQLAALQTRPAEVRGTRRSFSVPVRATDDIAEVGRVDVVLLTLKAHQLSAVAPLLDPLFGDDTVVVTTQNGIPWWYFSVGGGPLAGTSLRSVDPDGTIAAHIDLRRVIAGAVYSGARLLAPGVVKQSGDLDYVFGEPSGAQTQRLQALVAALQRAGVDAVARADIRQVMWTKLLGNTTFNPISALTRATAAEMVEDPQVSALVRAAMLEQIALGARVGIDIDISVDARIARTALLGAQRTSMLQDVDAGRPLETEGILGAVVEIADRVGADIPVTRHLYALVRLLERALERERAA